MYQRKLFIAISVICLLAFLCACPWIVPSYPFLSLRNDEIEYISVSYFGDPPEYILSSEQQMQFVNMLQSVATYKKPRKEVYVGASINFKIVKKNGEIIYYEDGDIVVYIDGIGYRAKHDYDVHEFFDRIKKDNLVN